MGKFKKKVNLRVLMVQMWYPNHAWIDRLVGYVN